MEKYYIGKIEELGHAGATSKLVEVQFLRRPPTFGLLLATTFGGGGGGSGDGNNSNSKSNDNGAHCAVRLVTLNLNSENKAKFATLRDVPLASGGQLPVATAALDTFNPGQLLVETSLSSSSSWPAGSSSSSSRVCEQLASSKVFALTQAGVIVAVPMTARPGDPDDHSEKLAQVSSEPLVDCARHCPRAPSARGQFLDLQVRAAPSGGGSGLSGTSSSSSPSSSSAAPAPAPADRVLHVLSQGSYLALSMRLKQTHGGAPSDWCDIELEQVYSLEAGAHAAHLLKRLELTRMLPLEASLRSALLESSDGSLRVVSRGRCLWNIPGGGSAMAGSASRRQALALLQSRPDARDEPETVLLSLTGANQLVAHSLTMNIKELPAVSAAAAAPGEASATPARGLKIDPASTRPGIEREDNNDDELDGALQVGGRPPGGPGDQRQQRRQDRDPDGLWPQEPSFELDQCWCIELDELQDSPMGAISSTLESCELEGEAESEGDRTTGNACLCTPLWLSGDGQSQQRQWPEILLVFHGHHALIFSCEHTDAPPFSVVYDRAFMSMTNEGTGGSSQQQQPQEERRVDLRARPRLVHNIKLIGAQPSDCLFNLIFLAASAQVRGVRRQPLAIRQARHFGQLGLMAAVTSEGHVLAFKLTSPLVLDASHKDNLYQQVLLDSLRDDTLLRHELERAESVRAQLRNDLAKLEALLEADDRAADGSALAAIGSASQVGGGRLADLITGGGGAGGGGGGGGGEIQVSLSHHELIGGLYELTVDWPSVIFDVAKVILFAQVDGSEILPPQPVVGQALVERVSISNKVEGRVGLRDELFSLDATSGGSQEAPRAKAVLELRQPDGSTEYFGGGSSGNNCTAGGGSARVQLPLFLQDGHAGRLSVFVLFAKHNHAHSAPAAAAAAGDPLASANTRQASQLFRSHVANSREFTRFVGDHGPGPDSDATRAQGQQHYPGPANRHQQLSFVLKELPVKPLMSYCISGTSDGTLGPDEASGGAPGELEAKQHHGTRTHTDSFEASGSFSGDQLLAWLDEILDMTLKRAHQQQQQQQQQQPQGGPSNSIRFRSTLTGCSLDLRLERTSERNSGATSAGEANQNRLFVSSGDPCALHLIKKHILKRATDSSIRLAVAPPVCWSESELEAARERQRRLLSAGHEHRQRQLAAMDGGGGGPRATPTPAHKELLLESLLGELDRMAELDGEPNAALLGAPAEEPLKWTGYLERSLRHDVEQLFSGM